jgi:hypothetical protein
VPRKAPFNADSIGHLNYLRRVIPMGVKNVRENKGSDGFG